MTQFLLVHLPAGNFVAQAVAVLQEEAVVNQPAPVELTEEQGVAVKPVPGLLVVSPQIVPVASSVVIVTIPVAMEDVVEVKEDKFQNPLPG